MLITARLPACPKRGTPLYRAHPQTLWELSHSMQPALGTLDYRPSEDEVFMNPRQRDYFRAKLENWKDEILRESRETLDNLQEESQNHPDMADRASSESDRALELRTRDRQRKLISKIDAALKRLDDGTYGYCEETGDPIG